MWNVTVNCSSPQPVSTVYFKQLVKEQQIVSLVVAVGCIDDLFQQLLTLKIGIIVMKQNWFKVSLEHRHIWILSSQQWHLLKMFRFLITIRFTMISVLKFYNCFDLVGSRIIKYWLKRWKWHCATWLEAGWLENVSPLNCSRDDSFAIIITQGIKDESFQYETVLLKKKLNSNMITLRNI